MEKVFAGPNNDKNRFDLLQLSEGGDEIINTKTKSKYSEDDYDCKK